MRLYEAVMEPDTGATGKFRIVVRDSNGFAVCIPLDGFSSRDEVERVLPGIAHAFNAGAHAYRSALLDSMQMVGVDARCELLQKNQQDSR